MTGEVIKSFLVGLGFEVDESSLAKFNKSISQATLRVTALFASVQAAAAGIVFGIKKIADSFEQLGYSFHIISPAINKALLLRRELLHAYSAAGVNIAQSANEALRLNISLTKTKYVLEAIYKSVGAKFFTLLTKQSDLFRQKLYANMPKIQRTLESFVHFIFKALEATYQLGERLWSILGRVYDFFVKLDQATNGWSTVILGIIAAWKLLNLEFLATPLGMLLTGLLAILALYDDFKTFQEGGKSFFNWSSVIPVIDAVTEVLKGLWQVLKDIGLVVGDVFVAFKNLITGNPQGFFNGLKSAALGVVDILRDVWSYLMKIFEARIEFFKWGSNKLSDLFHGKITKEDFGNQQRVEGPANQDPSQSGDGGPTLFDKLKTLFNNPNAQVNVNGLQPTASGAPASPLGANNSRNSTVNMNVSQQTTISASPGADVNALGRENASSQKNANMDLSRILGKATIAN